MADDRFPFVVGENSSREAAVEALEGLKRMVAAGEAAKKALEALEKDGCWDHVVRWIGSGDRPSLRASRFPRYQPISPDDLPVMADLSLEIQPSHFTQYGGHSCREYPLVLHGDCMRSHKKGLVRVQLDGGVLVGTLRVSKVAISWLSGRSGAAYLVTEKRKTLGAVVGRIARSDALEPLSDVIARYIVVKGPNEYLGQKAMDLRKAAGGWLLEQGHTLRMLEHVVRMLWVEGVMDD